LISIQYQVTIITTKVLKKIEMEWGQIAIFYRGSRGSYFMNLVKVYDPGPDNFSSLLADSGDYIGIGLEIEQKRG